MLDLSLITPILTIISIWIAIWVLKSNHDRSRREFATKLMWDWTLQTNRYKRAAFALADLLNKEQCESIVNMETVKINTKHKKLILSALNEMAITEEKLTITQDGLF